MITTTLADDAVGSRTREEIDAFINQRTWVPLPQLAKWLGQHPDTLRYAITSGRLDIDAHKPLRGKTSAIVCLAADIYRLLGEEPPAPIRWSDETPV